MLRQAILDQIIAWNHDNPENKIPTEFADFSWESIRDDIYNAIED